MPTPPRLSHRAAVAAALLVTFLWSSSWVLIRWGLDDEGLEPITFASLRYGLAAMLVVAWLLLGKRRAARRSGFRTGVPRKRLLWKLALLGIAVYGITQGAQFVAIANQPAATTSLVLSLTPLIVALTAAVSLAEVPSRRQLTGTLLVTGGAWLYFAGGILATTLGMVAAIVALLANVAGGLLGRHLNRDSGLSAVTVTAVSMSVGAATLVLIGLALEGVPHVSPRAWIIILWLAAINTALAFSLWNLSLQRLSAVESAGINNTMLIQIAVLAWLFLDESPDLAGFAGIGLVSLGVFLVQARAENGDRAGGARLDRGPAPDTRPRAC